eukprot:3337155-Rhodomonas_salina.1
MDCEPVQVFVPDRPGCAPPQAELNRNPYVQSSSTPKQVTSSLFWEVLRDVGAASQDVDSCRRVGEAREVSA